MRLGSCGVITVAVVGLAACSSDRSAGRDATLADSGAPDAKMYRGGVTLLHNTSGGLPGYVFAFTPSFSTSADYSPPSSSCHPTDGDCCVNPTSSWPAPIHLQSAGTVTLLDDAATLAVATPTNAPPFYAGSILNPPTNSLTWRDGDTLTIDATGDAVRPFNGTIRIGGTISGLGANVATKTTSSGSSRSSTIVWNPDETLSGERMSIGLVIVRGPVTENDIQGRLSCVVDDDAGQVSVPDAIVRQIEPGDTLYVNATRSSSVTITTDNATIDLVQNTFDTWQETIE
jgi:hypothetical protein